MRISRTVAAVIALGVSLLVTGCDDVEFAQQPQGTPVATVSDAAQLSTGSLTSLATSIGAAVEQQFQDTGYYPDHPGALADQKVLHSLPDGVVMSSYGYHVDAANQADVTFCLVTDSQPNVAAQWFSRTQRVRTFVGDRAAVRCVVAS